METGSADFIILGASKLMAMRVLSALLLFLSFSLAAAAQKTTALYDLNFKPTQYGGRYYVETGKEGELWHRKAWYIPENTLAMEAWYKDEAGKVSHGKETWYHTTRYPKQMGQWVDGKKEGPWLEYSDKGQLLDSSTYVNGFYSGDQFHWDTEGWLTDSARFDGAGNGVAVHWNQGVLSSAGRYIRDTAKVGRWTYYHPNGQKLATQDYVGDGEPVCHCWDSTGVELASELCKEREARFPGNSSAWSNFLSRRLDPQVPGRNGAKRGSYLIVVQFIVDKDGSIQDIKPLSHYGFGMEEEVVRLMKASPKWIPAQQFGRAVKAYRKQPITFIVSE